LLIGCGVLARQCRAGQRCRACRPRLVESTLSDFGGMSSAHKIAVRNTFIDVLARDEDEDEDVDLGRTRSDPTGGRTKNVQTLLRISELPRVTPVPEGPTAAEAGEEDVGVTEEVDEAAEEAAAHDGNDDIGDGEALCDDDDEDEDEDDDDDDDDDSPLERTAGHGVLSAKVAADPAYVSISSSATSSSATAKDGVACKDGTTAKDEAACKDGATGKDGAACKDSVRTKNKGPAKPFELAGLLEEPTGAARAPPYPGGMPMEALSAWGYPGHPFHMYSSQWPMYSPMGYPPVAPAGSSAENGREESSSSDWHPASIPELGAGPPIGMSHSFHQETRNMGSVTPDLRQFTKVGYEGRLSVVSESQVHIDGVQRYLVQFSSGELSRADGVGFVFSPRLPCAKNIQRIVSIFVNQRGRICMRVFADIVRASAFVKPLECGDWVEMCIDLDNRMATFNVWPNTSNGWPPVTGTPSSTAEFPFGNKLTKLNQAGAKPVKLNVGHLACVVKNTGVTVTLGS